MNAEPDNWLCDECGKDADNCECGDTLQDDSDEFMQDECDQCEQCSCFGKPEAEVNEIEETDTLSFHDLDVNELVLISEAPKFKIFSTQELAKDSSYLNLLRRTVITEMQERFLHTFCEDCC